MRFLFVAVNWAEVVTVVIVVVVVMVEIVMIINADIKAVEKEMAEVVSQKLFRELENVILLKTVDRL